MRLLSIAVLFVFANFVSAASNNFSVRIVDIKYSDQLGRNVNYNFTQGLLSGDTLYLPSWASTAGIDEVDPEYIWGVSPWHSQTVSYSGSQYRLNIPQPATVLKDIPVSASPIIIDASTADWSAIPAHIVDRTGEVYDPASDVAEFKVAYSPASDRLNFLIRLSGTASSDKIYSVYLDKDLNGQVWGTRDYMLQVRHNGSSWVVVSLGWRTPDDNDEDLYEIADNDQLAINGNIIEFSVRSAAFGLPAPVNVFGEVWDGYKEDSFTTNYKYSEGFASLSGYGISAQYSNDWSWQVRLSNFANTSQQQYHYDVDVEAGNRYDDVTSGSIYCTWFSGNYAGQTFQNALILGADVENESEDYDWEWSGNGPGLVINGLDPAATQLDLLINVTNGGRRFEFKYRINSDLQSAWHVLTTHDLPSYLPSSRGLPEVFPLVNLEAGYAWNVMDFDEDGIVGFRDLAMLSSLWQSHDYDENWVSDADISDPADGVIDFKDIAVFLDNWLEP